MKSLQSQEAQIRNKDNVVTNQKNVKSLEYKSGIFSKSEYDGNQRIINKKLRKKANKYKQPFEQAEHENKVKYFCDQDKNIKGKDCTTNQKLYSLVGSTDSVNSDNRKFKKKKTSTLNQNIKSNNFDQINEESNLKNVVKCSSNKEALPSRSEMKIKEELYDNKKDLLIEKLPSLKDEDYKPGMLSDLLQIKKYGRLIIPWDPSFGLDPNYKIPDYGEESKLLPRLKINPLFDLSKRKDIASNTSVDSIENTLFVGNLPAKTTSKELKKMFRKFGLVLHVKLRFKGIKNLKKLTDSKKDSIKDGKQINALVKFQYLESCKAALKMNGKVYEGHHLRVTLVQDVGKSDHQNSIFVGNLAFRAQDDDLWKAFEDCGDIKSVRIIRDQRTGQGKGYGYVNFKSIGAVEKAVKLDGMSILDRDVRVRGNDSHASSLSDTVIAKKKRIKKKKFTPGCKNCTPQQSEEFLGENKPRKRIRVKHTSKESLEKETESSIHKKLKQKKKSKKMVINQAAK